MTILTTYPPGTRVMTPGGIPGTVEKLSTRPNARWPILVKRDDGQTRSYAPSELLAIATPEQGQAIRGVLP